MENETDPFPRLILLLHFWGDQEADSSNSYLAYHTSTQSAAEEISRIEILKCDHASKELIFLLDISSLFTNASLLETVQHLCIHIQVEGITVKMYL